MNSLFSDDSPTEAGYRLHYLEVYNWGTFDGTHRITLDGRTTLLTGANGSGKTTLVDALLTLLVPRQGGRLYNQSAGTAKRGERTEETYVLGHYGRSQAEGELTSKPDALRRPGTTYSVLLAVFDNAALGPLTLAQVFHYRPSGELHVDYFVLHTRVSAADLGAPDGAGWKPRLRRQWPDKVETFDSFEAYGQRLRMLLGMKSREAQTLFGKAVGLKALDSLDRFIRTEMLSAGPAEERFSRLRQQYQQLMEAQQAIRLAQRQVGLLNPLRDYDTDLTSAETHLATAADVRLLVQHRYATGRLRALATEVDQIEEEALRLKNAENAATREKERKRAEVDQLNMDIGRSDSQQRLTDLNRRLDELAGQRARQQQTLKDYNIQALHLGLEPDPVDAEAFGQQRRDAQALVTDLEAADAIARDTADSARAEIKTLRLEYDVHAADLALLRKRPSNITGPASDIREKLATHLGVQTTELPFVGELLQVRATESEWEGALEKLLHNFALHVLVPPAHYEAVTRYVNATHLGGLFEFYQVSDRPALAPGAPAAGTVPEKLDVLETSPHRDWLRHTLARQFGKVVCVEADADLPSHDEAITRNGLIRNRTRHRKDDRRKLFDRTSYVLGWDTAAKIRELDRQLIAVNGRLQRGDIGIRQLEEEQTTRRKRTDEAKAFLLLYPDFAALDGAATAREIGEKEAQKQALLNSPESARLRQLEKQRDEAFKQEQFHEAKSRSLSNRHTEKTNELRRGREAMNRCERQLAELRPPLPTETLLTAAEAYLPTLAPDEAPSRWSEAESAALEQWTNDFSAVSARKQKLEADISRLLTQLTNPRANTYVDFPKWHDELPKLDPLPAHRAEFLTVLDQLEYHDLPAHEARFAQLVGDEMRRGIVNFKMGLNEEVKAIDAYLRDLNASLRRIVFTPGPEPTYIELVKQPTTTPRIRDFRQRLANLDLDFDADPTDAVRRDKQVGAISSLITDLDRDEPMRREVTDVRNWFTFKAQEYASAPAGGAPRPVRTYEGGADGLSGGQKAQLTYTILAAAVAWQFNINQQGLQAQSFRFLAVDEAFSKLDATKSRFLMELCEQLHLQLLVVTPDDKVALVQDYVSALHFVINPRQRHSRVVDLTVEEYQAQRHGTPILA